MAYKISRWLTQVHVYLFHAHLMQVKCIDCEHQIFFAEWKLNQGNYTNVIVCPFVRSWTYYVLSKVLVMAL